MPQRKLWKHFLNNISKVYLILDIASAMSNMIFFNLKIINDIYKMEYINKIFDDEVIIKRIKMKLPEFFQMANVESSRAGKVGMEVGVLREKVQDEIIAQIGIENYINKNYVN